MTDPVDPETGAPLHRDVRPFTLTYKGESITFDMPGRATKLKSCRSSAWTTSTSPKSSPRPTRLTT